MLGKDFEVYLQRNLSEGKELGQIRAEINGIRKSRDFDGSYMNGGCETWFEAKSGGFWDDPKRIQKFRTNAGEQAQIAEAYRKRFEVHSSSPIPNEVKLRLEKRKIPFVEW